MKDCVLAFTVILELCFLLPGSNLLRLLMNKKIRNLNRWLNFHNGFSFFVCGVAGLCALGGGGGGGSGGIPCCGP